MEFLSEEETSDRYGEAIALQELEIKNMIKLAKPTKNDTFYDLGSGYGEIVRYVFRNTNVKRAIGIESDIKRFIISIEKTRNEFYKKDLKNIDFWCVDFRDCKISNATIIYNGIEEFCEKGSLDDEEKKLYNEFFKDKKIKIIKRDLPLIGYKSVKSIRDKKGSWFFLMKTPLEDYKILNKNKWLEHVFKSKNKTTMDLAKYYAKQYEKRGIKTSKKELKEYCKYFERIAEKRFTS